MDGFRTVGQAAATGAVRAMLGGRVPHAVLIAGPPSIGKHTLALDLAAGLLCTGTTGAGRPCRTCRGCRMVDHGNHPDLHQLAPSGPGRQIRIGEDQHPEPGTVRRLAVDLALLPVEGGERVAVIRDAQRMNEVAQSALLKTLEEPPPATTIVLCVDDEEQLLPTIRSRCARIRLGMLATREIERLLADLGAAEAPTAARLARLAGGRPGIAVAYARAPEAEQIRGELVRTLLDLLGRRRAARLAASRDLLSRSMALVASLEPASPSTSEPPRPRSRARGAASGDPAPAATQAPGSGDTADGSGDTANAAADLDGDAAPGKASAADRRRGLALLLDLWRELARDLACAQGDAAGSIRDIALLEELEAAARRLPAGAASQALAELVRAGELLDVNVTPELLLDVLLLRWPRLEVAA